MSTKGNSHRPKRIRRGIRLDRVNPSDYLKFNFMFSCEQCTHFDKNGERCTIGYNSLPHRHVTQVALYERTGHMALCRFHEVD